MWGALLAALLPLARFLSEHWLACAAGGQPSDCAADMQSKDRLRCWGCRLQALLPSGIGIAGAVSQPAVFTYVSLLDVLPRSSCQCWPGGRLKHVPLAHVLCSHCRI